MPFLLAENRKLFHEQETEKTLITLLTGEVSNFASESQLNFVLISFALQWSIRPRLRQKG